MFLRRGGGCVTVRPAAAMDAAVAAYTRAIEINANYAEAYNNLGVALQRQGQVGPAAAAPVR